MEKNQWCQITREVLDMCKSMEGIMSLLKKINVKETLGEINPATDDVIAGVTWSIRNKSCRDWEESLRN